MKKFLSYACVGLGNTVLHWSVFFLAYALGSPQSLANVAGFLAAVTFSFVVNARLTFQRAPTLGRYLVYTAFLALLSLGLGALADLTGLHPLLTLTGFSALSLVAGFLFADRIVFK